MTAMIRDWPSGWVQSVLPRAQALLQSYDRRQKNGFVSEDGWQAAVDDEDDDLKSFFEGNVPNFDTLMAANNADTPVTDEHLPAELSATAVVDDHIPSELGHPLADDPYWGMNSNMFGIARSLDKNNNWVPILDHRYLEKYRRYPNVVGHNGNAPGAWFPMQPIAVFCGAHGAMQGGVYGDAKGGAYSIVLSSEYAKVNYDEDDGNTIFYAAKESKKHAIADEVPPESQYTRYLRTSKENKQPVRVLRSSYDGMPGYFKGQGLRYDGLYMIDDVSSSSSAMSRECLLTFCECRWSRSRTSGRACAPTSD